MEDDTPKVPTLRGKLTGDIRSVPGRYFVWNILISLTQLPSDSSVDIFSLKQFFRWPATLGCRCPVPTYFRMFPITVQYTICTIWLISPSSILPPLSLIARCPSTVCSLTVHYLVRRAVPLPFLPHMVDFPILPPLSLCPPSVHCLAPFTTQYRCACLLSFSLTQLTSSQHSTAFFFTSPLPLQPPCQCHAWLFMPGTTLPAIRVTLQYHFVPLINTIIYLTTEDDIELAFSPGHKNVILQWHSLPSVTCHFPLNGVRFHQ